MCGTAEYTMCPPAMGHSRSHERIYKLHQHISDGSQYAPIVNVTSL